MRYVLALTLAATAAHAETMVIKPGSAWSDGGYINQYLEKRATVDAVEIRGACKSACALVLGHQSVCVERTATIGFHGLSYDARKLWKRAEWSEHEKYARNLNNTDMMRWYLSGPAKSRRMTWVSGTYVIESFGVKECDA